MSMSGLLLFFNKNPDEKKLTVRFVGAKAAVVMYIAATGRDQ